MRTIKANPYKFNSDNYFENGTIEEIKRMENCGCERLSVNELNEKLNSLGFKIEKSNSFYYTNTSNENKYNAYSCYIVDIKTKLSFAHIDFGNNSDEHERLEQLRPLRINYFAVELKKNKTIIYEF